MSSSSPRSDANLESSIDTIVQAVTDERDVSTGLLLFLKGVVQLTQSDTGTIYKLYLDKSRYLPVAKYDNRSGQFREILPAAGLEVGTLLNPNVPTANSLEQAIRSRSIINKFRSGIFVPVVRGHSCLGVLHLESAKDLTNKHFVEFARGLLFSLFERQSSLDLLRAVQQPIDFNKPIDDFLEDVLLLVAIASKMPFIIIHELDENLSHLRCIASYGFGSIERHLFDLEPLGDFPPFAEVAREARTVVVTAVDTPGLGNLSLRPELSSMKSFVIAPIKVGTMTFGTLVFGAACPFDYSPLEIAGLESIANGIGTAITNFRNARRLGEISGADAKLGVSISGLEVAQSARHEVRGAVDDCVASLATLRNYLKTPKVNVEQIEATIGKVGDDLFKINLAMDKIKDASREPDDILKMTSLKNLWDQAQGLVAAKLDEEHIHTQIIFTGKERESQIEVFPDSLRHAFLHLLLNSIDAFKERRIKGSREIKVSIDPQSGAAINIKMRYTDNATGIDPSSFKQISADPSKEVKDLIFEKGVTTKSSGSGYGLYLTRMILARHHGSIELVNYRGGVVFDITLPKDLRSKVERKEGKRLA